MRKILSFVAYLVFLPVAAVLGAAMGVVGFTHGYSSAYPGRQIRSPCPSLWS